MDANACGVLRGRARRGSVRCELPFGHSDRWHFGRSPSGRWFSWPVAAGPAPADKGGKP